MTSLWPLLRGRVYAARLSNLDEDKYFLVVSNNRRNNQLPQVHAVRLTTTPKPDLPSIVRLGPPEAFNGSVICDDIVEIWQDEVARDLGALSPKAMKRWAGASWPRSTCRPDTADAGEPLHVALRFG